MSGMTGISTLSTFYRVCVAVSVRSPGETPSFQSRTENELPGRVRLVQPSGRCNEVLVYGGNGEAFFYVDTEKN